MDGYVNEMLNLNLCVWGGFSFRSCISPLIGGDSSMRRYSLRSQVLQYEETSLEWKRRWLFMRWWILCEYEVVFKIRYDSFGPLKVPHSMRGYNHAIQAFLSLYVNWKQSNCRVDALKDTICPRLTFKITSKDKEWLMELITALSYYCYQASYFPFGS